MSNTNLIAADSCLFFRKANIWQAGNKALIHCEILVETTDKAFVKLRTFFQMHPCACLGISQTRKLINFLSMHIFYTNSGGYRALHYEIARWGTALEVSSSSQYHCAYSALICFQVFLWYFYRQAYNYWTFRPSTLSVRSLPCYLWKDFEIIIHKCVAHWENVQDCSVAQRSRSHSNFKGNFS